MDSGTRKMGHSGDILSIGKRSFKLEYVETGRAADLERFSEEMENIVKTPLLDKANLVHPPRHSRRALKDTPPADLPDDE